MSDLFEENEDNQEVVLTNSEDFVEQLEVPLKHTLSQGDIRRQLEDLLEKKRLEDELDDFGDL